MTWREHICRLFATMLLVVGMTMLPTSAAEATEGQGNVPGQTNATGQESESEQESTPEQENVPGQEGTPEQGSASDQEDAPNQENAPDQENASEQENMFGPENLLDPNLLPDSSFIYDVSIDDLGGADSYYSNQTVQVTGEAIGDNIRANFSGSNRWITLQSTQATDGVFANVSVFMSRDAASRIEHFGTYSEKGDIVQVRGTFHLVCPQHEGLTDLHAEYVNIVQRGSEIERPFRLGPFVPGAVLLGVGVILVIVFNRLRERLR